MGKKRFELSQEEIEVSRIRVPHEGETLGVVEVMLGADKIRVKCDDGNTRICRIPGRMRKKVWIKTNDLVLIQPWNVQAHERGDVIFRYTSTQANYLRRKGFVKSIAIG